MNSILTIIAAVVGIVADPAPPARDYSSGPHTATTYYSPDPVAECISWNGPGRRERGKIVIGCYVPMIDTIIESWRCDPSRGRKPEAWCAAHHEHEERHARGERHPD